ASNRAERRSTTGRSKVVGSTRNRSPPVRSGGSPGPGHATRPSGLSGGRTEGPGGPTEPYRLRLTARVTHQLRLAAGRGQAEPVRAHRPVQVGELLERLVVEPGPAPPAPDTQPGDQHERTEHQGGTGADRGGRVERPASEGEVVVEQIH